MTPNREKFEPDRNITRAESYAMIMAAFCLYPTGPSEDSWQEKLYTVARKEGITNKEMFEDFEANREIYRQELYVITARTADWADRTGGCHPKPAECVS